MGCHTSKHTYNRHKMAMINSSSSFFLYRLDRISSGSTRIDWINRTDLFANDRKITHRGYFQSHLITIERYIPVTTFLQCKQNIWLYHIAHDKYRKNTMLSIPRRLSPTTAAVYIFRTLCHRVVLCSSDFQINHAIRTRRHRQDKKWQQGRTLSS